MGKERFNAWLATLFIVALWVAGFYNPIIHVYLSAFATLSLAFLPHWIVDMNSGDCPCCKEEKK